MECPYCEAEFDYCDDEPKGEDVQDETECPECEKIFVFTRSYSVSYHTQKADCLNGSAHDFEAASRIPAVVLGHVLYRCTQCGTEEKRKAKCQHGGPYCLECFE